MADSVVSSGGDSDDGPLFVCTTSKEVATLPAVDSDDSNDSGLLIVGATPTPAPGSSKTAVADSDEEDEELLAVAAVGLARPAEAVARAASTTNSIRYKWPKPSDIFKGQPDEKLYAIVKQALVERPWSSKSQTKAWDIIAGNLRSHHSHVFNLGISGTQASAKFNMIMKETKRWSDSAPFCSGGDNESENSFVQACEEIVELRDSWKALEDDKKSATAASKEKDKKAAEVMRRASIGNFTRDNLLNLKRDETSPRVSTPTPSSAFRTISSVNDLMASSAESLSDHRAAIHQRNEEKAERKKQKLVLAEKRLEEESAQSAQKLALEEKRFEEERTQAAHARALELRKMELEEKKWTFMLNNQKKG